MAYGKKPGLNNRNSFMNRRNTGYGGGVENRGGARNNVLSRANNPFRRNTGSNRPNINNANLNRSQMPNINQGGYRPSGNIGRDTLAGSSMNRGPMNRGPMNRGSENRQRQPMNNRNRAFNVLDLLNNKNRFG